MITVWLYSCVNCNFQLIHYRDLQCNQNGWDFSGFVCWKGDGALFPLSFFKITFSLLLCMNEPVYLSLSLSLRRPHWGGAGCVGATRWEEGGGAHALQETLAGGADLHGCIHASRWRHTDWDTHLYLSSMYFSDWDVKKWDNIYLWRWIKTLKLQAITKYVNKVEIKYDKLEKTPK